ncbi:hypothetical protein [Stanieria cyanosphaera]|nr:hypothetical protein [Stanieria cyanosphaera]
MINTVSPSMQPPQAPSPPVVAQQALSELVNYYRELARYHRSSVDYHQQLLEQHVLEAEAAEKQLASIEAILHPLQTKSSSPQTPKLVPQEISDRANGQQVNGTGKIRLSEEKAQEKIAEKDSATLASEESKPEKKATEVEKSNSKTSQLSDRQSLKNNSKTKSSSTKTAKTKKPTTQKNPAKTKSSTSTNSLKLPYSEKLAFYETTVNAVAVCLQEFYPQVVSAEDVIKYYYPEGLAGEDRKKAYAAFSNGLSKGAGKQGWVRTSVGKYRWKNEGETKT